MARYHRISRLISAEQLPAEYMGGNRTHLTDFDPESGELGSARHPRRRGEGPSKEVVDHWIMMFNSGASVREISKGSGWPYQTVENEIAKHPAKSRGKESTVPITCHLPTDLVEQVEAVRGAEPASKFLRRLLETGVGDMGYSRAAAKKEPTKADAERWLRMHRRGMSPAQIAEAVGGGWYPKEVRDALRLKGVGIKPRVRSKDAPPRKKITLRISVWLRDALDALAQRAGQTRAELMQSLVGRAVGAPA